MKTDDGTSRTDRAERGTTTVGRISSVTVSLLLVASAASAQNSVLSAAVSTLSYGTLSVAAVHRLGFSSSAVKSGSVVRLSVETANGRRRLVGPLITVDADSIAVGSFGDSLGASVSAPQRVARVDIKSAQVLTGRERKWAQGWAAGLATGATIGVITGFASGDDKNCVWFCFTATNKAAILGVALGVSGSAFGSLIGALITGDAWKSGRLPFDARAALVPVGRRGIGVGANVQF